MTQHLEREVSKLKKKILSLCALTEESLQMAIKSLESRDDKLAHAVIKRDLKIDQEEVEVEEECLKILALHQPVAIDLRFIVAVLKINSDLERIGDLSSNIAERALILTSQPHLKSPVNLVDMAGKVKVMLKSSLDALVNMDEALAKNVLTLDDEIDDIYRLMYKGIVTQIQSEPSTTIGCLNLLSVSRQLERIADHATNICEDVIYMVSGEIIRHQNPNPTESES
jgi:phosphate transport system protein